LDSGWPKEPCIRCGPRVPQAKGQFLGERTCPGMPNDTPPMLLCKKGRTDWEAIWDVDSGEPKEACITCGAHRRNLVNTTEPPMYSGDAAFSSNYFDHLLLVAAVVS